MYEVKPLEVLKNRAVQKICLKFISFLQHSIKNKNYIYIQRLVQLINDFKLKGKTRLTLGKCTLCTPKCSKKMDLMAFDK